MQKKITPFLWFDKNMKEITDFYMSVFPDAKLTTRGTLSDTPSGEVEMATFEIFGQQLDLMTAGPMFTFNEAISFMVSCDTQEEIDYYWEKLSAVPAAEQCGWLKDKYGLSWQIVPTVMNDMMAKGTKEQISRVTQAFMKMKKFKGTIYIVTLKARKPQRIGRGFLYINIKEQSVGLTP